MDFLLIEMLLWSVVIISLFLCSGLFLRKAMKDINKSSKSFFLCVSFFFLSTGGQRVLSLIFDFFLTSFLFLLLFITLLNIISIIPLLFHLENSVLKSKRIISVMAIIMVIVYIVAYFLLSGDRLIMIYFFLPTLLLGTGSVLYIYTYLFIKSSGQIRKNASYILFGIILIVAFWMIHSNLGRASPNPDPNLIDIVGIISPIGYIIGLLFLTSGFMKRSL